MPMSFRTFLDAFTAEVRRPVQNEEIKLQCPELAGELPLQEVVKNLLEDFTKNVGEYEEVVQSFKKGMCYNWLKGQCLNVHCLHKHDVSSLCLVLTRTHSY